MSGHTSRGLSNIFEQQEDDESMFVCQDCLEDEFLRLLTPMSLHKPRVCVVCQEPVIAALTASWIARLLRDAIPRHCEIDYGLHSGYELDLPTVISDIIGCNNDELCDGLSSLLVDDHTVDEDEHAFFAQGQQYLRARSQFESEEHERWYVVGEWRRIADKLTYGQRFFNTEVERFIDEVIANAIEARSPDGGEAAVRVLPVGSKFFRARILSDRRALHDVRSTPSSFLGAPPREKAAHNRMNAAGIPFLYVADHEQTCIAEVRPSIGDEVLVGAVTTTRPLKFFDFNGLDSLLSHSKISPFWPDYAKRVERRALLSYLHDEIARPVDQNQHGYVATQAIAEFIRHKRPEGFDGIGFRSVQRDGGVNYVFFGDRDDHSPVSTADVDPNNRFPVHFEGDPQLFKVTGVEFRTDTITAPIYLPTLAAS